MSVPLNRKTMKRYWIMSNANIWNKPEPTIDARVSAAATRFLWKRNEKSWTYSEIDARSQEDIFQTSLNVSNSERVCVLLAMELREPISALNPRENHTLNERPLEQEEHQQTGEDKQGRVGEQHTET
jgi:hypothetical protein